MEVKMSLDCLVVMDRILVRQRNVICESWHYFKVYLPMECDDLWEKVKNNNRLVDI
ncbi:hypothetical protein [Desulfurococcus sp.]|uniref:hypothetical protein n=2 Tax=Desulfurococcus sp. TaxID=51678 RepID=UPI00315E9229